jgi:crotonobetainyl-CoA:carnitine CoA-transferase CaiB-like acyl-CoA transferase
VLDADVYGPGRPIAFSGSAAGFDQPARGIGEHNGEICGDLLGYTQSELHEFQSTGVI